MNMSKPPEIADGGYWYPVSAVVVGQGTTVLDFNTTGWCAWYGLINGKMYAAVRTPQPASDIATEPNVSLSQILALGKLSSSKPRGRVGGV